MRAWAVGFLLAWVPGALGTTPSSDSGLVPIYLGLLEDQATQLLFGDRAMEAARDLALLHQLLDCPFPPEVGLTDMYYSLVPGGGARSEKRLRVHWGDVSEVEIPRALYHLVQMLQRWAPGERFPRPEILINPLQTGGLTPGEVEMLVSLLYAFQVRETEIYGEPQGVPDLSPSQVERFTLVSLWPVSLAAGEKGRGSLEV